MLAAMDISALGVLDLGEGRDPSVYPEDFERRTVHLIAIHNVGADTDRMLRQANSFWDVPFEHEAEAAPLFQPVDLRSKVGP
jgi:hypothetical protein